MREGGGRNCGTLRYSSQLENNSSMQQTCSHINLPCPTESSRWMLLVWNIISSGKSFRYLVTSSFTSASALHEKIYSNQTLCTFQPTIASRKITTDTPNVLTVEESLSRWDCILFAHFSHNFDNFCSWLIPSSSRCLQRTHLDDIFHKIFFLFYFLRLTAPQVERKWWLECRQV